MVNTIAQVQQRTEDYQFERDVQLSAEDYLRQLSNDVGLVVLAPRRFMYCIYDEETAKYKNADYSKMIRDKVNEIDPTAHEEYKKRALAKINKYL